MKSMTLLTLLLAASLQAFASHHTALTDDDITAMVQHGVPADTILKKIKTLRSAFDTSPDAAQILAKSGVSADIITAMMAAVEGR